MVNTAVQSNESQKTLGEGRRRRERIFCTLHEAAVFLQLPYPAIRQRCKRGTMVGLARAIDGSPWTPAGRAHPLVEASVLREHLDERTRDLFDHWQAGRLTLKTVKRRMENGTS